MRETSGESPALRIAAAILIAGWAPWAAAQQEIVEIPASGDTSIYEGEGFDDNSCGAGSNLYAGVTDAGLRRRALMRFDVAGSIPPGATVERVTLTLDVNRAVDAEDAPMTLHALAGDWGEGAADCDPVLGGGQGIDAGPGDATWLDARFQELAWLAPGGDFGDARATTSVGIFGPAVWDSAEIGNGGMVADVQGWLDDPPANHGWIVVGDETRYRTTRRFSSREGAAAPLLTVELARSGGLVCCFEEGACSLLDAALCSGLGGIPEPSVATCDPNPCPQPLGACCQPDETCSEDVTPLDCDAGGGTFQGGGSACSDPGVDCGLEPFVDPLPIPAVLQPVGGSPGVPRYEITMTQERQQLHRDLPPTDVWTYNGTFPGPTIEAEVDQPIEVRYLNRLPAPAHYLPVDECAHGPDYWRDSARAVVHLHGGHVPARFDGQPEYHILPGESDLYAYPNRQPPATLWYHDHALGITRLNVYMGMAGFYLLRDDFERGLGLPRGEFEIPLVVQDRAFHPDGSFSYPSTIEDAFYGDRVLVNGKVWPYLRVAQGRYRLRVLNGSQARVYRLRLTDLADPARAIPFQLIGTDGGLIGEPIALDSFTMAPAERFDVVVDFSDFPAGSEIVLKNDEPAVPAVANVMKFIVEGRPGHAADLPPLLRPVAAIPESEATVTRRFLLRRGPEPCAGRRWLIESLDEMGDVIGSLWDEVSEFPLLGTTEIWELDNLSTMMHPMHLHLVLFQVLERLDKATGEPIPLEPWERTTWKDTVRVPPDTVVKVIARFEDYPGRFAYHCHLLDHEDHEMMRQFQTVHDPAFCDGDGLCELGEDCVSCGDCAAVSGASCGNGLCEVGDGEDCANCPGDCAGGGGESFCCGGDVACDDERCGRDGFFCRAAQRLSACCGDRLCEGAESAAGCAVDCGDVCVPGPGTLCLRGGRFRVEVAWEDFAGGTGSGRVVPFGSDDSGLFWFFAADNWEMLVKVLDGCGFNNRFWVFAAATTNVGYTLRVTDTSTGAVKEYVNPLGVASPALTDTGAFACP